MTRLIIFLLLCVHAQQLFAQTPRKIALIVAVGNYPESSGWQPIHSRNDAAMLSTALIRQGFKASNVTQLTDAEATKEGILKALRKLVKTLKPGDVFFFQFSGHGQQVADDNGDELDGYDEAIVPFDSPMKFEKNGYQGQNLIRDEELGALLEEARRRIGPTGNVMVILDSCHSGTGTRAMSMARGTDYVMADSGYIAQQPRNKQENGWIPGAENGTLAPMVAYFGSSAGQLNYETRDEMGQPVGSLTYAFCRKLNDAGSKTTYRSLFDQIRTTMAGIAPYQTPQSEGNLDQQLFGGFMVEAPQYSRISQCKSRTVINIEAGWMHSLHEGTVVGLFPPDTPSPSAAEPIAKGILLTTEPFESVVKLETPLKSQSDCSAWVYTLEKNFGPLKASVFLNLDKQDPVAEAVRNRIRELTVITETDDDPDLHIVHTGAEVQLKKGTLVLEKMDAKKSAGIIAERMVRKILAWAQADYLRNLQAENEDLKVSVELIPIELDGSNRFKRELPLSSKTDAQGNIRFKSGDPIRVRVRNNGLQTAYFSLLDIQSNNEVMVLAPSPKETPEELKIAPGQTIDVPTIFQLYTSNGKELLKLLATDQPVDLRSITQTRGVGQESARSALEQLFAQTYFNEECLTRGGKTTNVPVENLHIHTVVFEVE